MHEVLRPEGSAVRGRTNARMSAVATAGTRIRYMGNKVALAGDVADLLEDVAPGAPLVDLFAGMCSIAGAVSRSGRQVWVNDVQQYAQLVGHCLLASRERPPSRDDAMRALVPGYRDNLAKLKARFGEELRNERRILARTAARDYRLAQETWLHAGNDADIADEVASLRTRHRGPHRLATLSFAWGYFGLQQSVEIDSVRAAIDKALEHGAITQDAAAWYRLALLQVCSRAASAPGHFAQYLNGKTDAGLGRIVASRRRSIWEGMLQDLEGLTPYGTRRWRGRNRVLGEDALAIWPTLDRARLPRPAIFYADPPYSKEQYSRFYHVLETLERYDYPESQGAGRYRPDRFVTPLSQKAGVLESCRQLFCEIAAREGTLVLSYPSSGLLTAGLGIDVASLLSEHFTDVREAIAQPSRHSTLGSRHGAARHEVTEFVWIAS